MIVARNVSPIVGVVGTKSTTCDTAVATPGVVLTSDTEIVPTLDEAGLPFAGIPVCVSTNLPADPAAAE